MRQLCSKNRLSRRAFVKATSGLFVPTLLLPKAAAQALTLNDPVLGVATKAAAGNGLLAGTVGYWKMDENVASGSRADATGNGWTATDHSSNIGNSSGLINLAANIAGSTDGFSVSATIDARAQTAAFAISFWLKGPGSAVSGNGVVSTIASGGTLGWLVYPASSSGSSALHWYTKDDSNSTNDILGATVINFNPGAGGTFNHILAGYNGTNKYLYINGTLDANFPVAVGGVTKGHNALVFGNYVGFSAGQTGLYDEIAYFNFMPSSTQVTTIYNGGNGLPFSSYS